MEPKCRANPDLWFDSDFQELAQAICLNCPLLKACTEWALSGDCNPNYGVVAGWTPADRIRLLGVTPNLSWKPLKEEENGGNEANQI